MIKANDIRPQVVVYYYLKQFGEETKTVKVIKNCVLKGNHVEFKERTNNNEW